MDTNLAISDELRIPSYYMIEVGDIVDALFTYSFFQLKPFSKKESQFTTDLEILSGHLSSEPQDQLTKFDRYVHDAIVSIYENLKLDILSEFNRSLAKTKDTSDDPFGLISMQKSLLRELIGARIKPSSNL